MPRKNQNNAAVEENSERTACLYTEKVRNGKPLCKWTVYDSDGNPIPVKTKDGSEKLRSPNDLTRGLCQAHYATVNAFRKAKGMDWEDIESKGLSEPAKEHVGRGSQYDKDADSIEGFLGLE